MTDSQNNLICPACGSEMQKVFISDKAINIDICSNGCGGIFFDNKEIQEFSGVNDDIGEIKKLIENKNFMPVDETKTRICPACNTPMAKTNAIRVQIDTCYKCGAIFLDNGEFEQVRTKFKKRKKVTPVNLNQNSDIKLEEFYRDAQEEQLQYEGYRTAAHLLRSGLRRRNPVSVLFDLLFW